MTPRKGIHLVVHHTSKTKAWAAIIRRASGEVSKIFSFSVYGGNAKAYKAANDWYSLHLPLYPLASRVQRMTTLRKNNRSGTTGVYRWPASGEICVGAYWAAKWVEVSYEKPKVRKFSIKRCGERGARAMAIEARRTALAQMRASELGE